MLHSTSFNDNLAREIHEIISWVSLFMLGGFSVLKNYYFHVVPVQTVFLLKTTTFRNACFLVRHESQEAINMCYLYVTVIVNMLN